MDIFISHSSKDRAAADATCAALENAGFRCWIAPRDIQPGSEWSAAIIEGIESSRLFVLVLTENSNLSQQVLREVERAVAKGLPIIPLRVEDVRPTKGLEYFISSQHWLDAFTPPLEPHLARLTETVHKLLGTDGNSQPTPTTTTTGPPTSSSRPTTSNRTIGAVVVVVAAAILIAAVAWIASSYLTGTKPTETTQTTDPPDQPQPEEKAPHDPLFAQTIAQRFRRWDENADRQLDLREIRRLLANWEAAREDVGDVLRRLDENGDGMLTEQELLRIGEDVVRHRDMDQDGRFTLAEFVATNRRDGGKNAPATMAKSFREEDADRDGFVTVVEMERAIALKLRNAD